MYIGAVLGGPGCPKDRGIIVVIRQASVFLGSIRPPDGSTGLIDLVFHIPGKLLKPPYQGLRTGKFSRKQRKLMIQAAVPESMVLSPDSAKYVVKTMREAVDLAAPRFQRYSIEFRIDLQYSMVSLTEQHLLRARA